MTRLPPANSLFADLPSENRPRRANPRDDPRPQEWVNAHCDGGARGNPGPSGYGAVLADEQGNVLAELSEFLGIRTNNFAEYSGLLGCLAWALKNQHPRLRVVSDSELMVKQIQGRYQVKSPDLKPLYDEAKRRIAQLEAFDITHALRHKNKDADRLANEAMDRGMRTVAQGVARARSQAAAPHRPRRPFPKPPRTRKPQPMFLPNRSPTPCSAALPVTASSISWAQPRSRTTSLSRSSPTDGPANPSSHRLESHHTWEHTMHRRQFLASTLAASLVAPAEGFSQEPSSSATPEFYELRRYRLASGPEPKLTETYFAEALIPALNRLGMTPIGSFSVDIGPETPTYYLLLPSPNLETLVTADLRLSKDDAFLKSAAPFWSAPAAAAPFARIESSLLRAFPGYPKLTPAPSGTKAKRIFQLRTYESPTNATHVRKIEMFHGGEFEIFARAGANSIFYADALIGPRLPALTYMLSFADMDALNVAWDKFRADPAWKKLSANPRYSSEAIVSNIDNLILRPLSSSQI